MTTHRRLAAVLGALLIGGCAGASSPLLVPTPEEIPSLEETLTSDPADVETGLRLAAAYREAGRLADARAVLATLRGTAPDDLGLIATEGLLAEDAGELSTARERYEAFLEAAPPGELRGEIERRLALVRTEELRADVRRALEREAELAQTAPDPATLGIFPFAFEGGDAEWEPLGRALAELLITDMSLTGRVRVLERVKVQTLLDELALTDAGFVDEGTAARSGRLLGSGYVLQGRYRIEEGARLGLDAALVEVGGPGEERVRPISAEDAVERLFDMEKALALDLHAELGVQLTPAERARLDERQTQSIQALLAFGRGLAAADVGNFQQAEQAFSEAAEIDPSFGLAQARRQATAAASSARSAAATRQLSARAARLSRRRAAVQALRNAPASVRQQLLQRLSQRQRAVLAEVLGQDRVGTVILLELIFRRPGGQQ